MDMYKGNVNHISTEYNRRRAKRMKRRIV
jgi:hypothetical protein